MCGILSPRFNTVDIGQGGQGFHTGFLSASLFLIIFASINEKNFFSFFIAEQNGKIFLLAGEGKAVRTGRAYIEDAPPHGMKVSRPETPSFKA